MKVRVICLLLAISFCGSLSGKVAEKVAEVKIPKYFDLMFT